MIKEQGLTPSMRREFALSTLASLKDDIKQRIADCLGTTDIKDPKDVASTLVYLELMDSILDHIGFMEDFYANK